LEDGGARKGADGPRSTASTGMESEEFQMNKAGQMKKGRQREEYHKD